MMVVPIAKVDLYELSNNSVWRAPFGFRATSTRPAGTASGVHPVPLGHSRVYVHLDGPFNSNAWIEGLRQGRSFVTTGPMLFAKVDGKYPGHVFEQTEERSKAIPVDISSLSGRPIARIEVLVNGIVAKTITPQNTKTPDNAFSTDATIRLSVAETSWIAVRSIQPMDDGRNRFAHTAPWHIEIAEKLIRHRKKEIDFLIRRVADEIKRNEGILNEAAMAEFREALEIYRKIAERAR